MEINGLGNKVREESEESGEQVKDTLNLVKLVNIVGAIVEDGGYCGENERVRGEVWKIGMILNKSKEMGFEG